ncbi:MAG: hypothetical protein ACRC4W_02775 [Treponemataceae bacterium]
MRVTKIYHPYASAAFAHARFGIDRLTSIAALNVLFVEVDGEIVSKTLDEKLTDGEITQEEFSQIKTSEVLSEQEQLLSWATSPRVSAKRSIDSSYDSQVKDFITQVLNIEKLKSFPLSVEFPQKPE